jgi:molybdopterin/thiamine biosynthesis adenylyltransferase
VSALHEFLRDRAEGDLLAWTDQLEACRRFAVSAAAVEGSALETGLLPMRYRRNRSTISLEEQLRLFRSRVAVIGCGGLGGYLIEELSRIGVGTLVVVDPDVFEEHNLNRQLLSSPTRLGMPKVDAARERVVEINPAVTVFPHRAALDATNATQLLAGCSAVVDGLDNVLTRRELAAACRELRVPLVHGAIAGWYGQVAVQLPGEEISGLLRPTPQGKGVETTLGNPSFTPAVIASLQVAETVKVLLARGTTLSGRVLFVNLLDMSFEDLRHAGHVATGAARSPAIQGG